MATPSSSDADAVAPVSEPSSTSTKTANPSPPSTLVGGSEPLVPKSSAQVQKQSAKPFISIPVSSIAPLVGEDPFKKAGSTLIQYIRRLNPTLHRQFVKKHSRPYADYVPSAEKLRRLDSATGGSILASIQSSTQPPLETQKTVIREIEDSKLAPDEKVMAIRAVTEVTNCRHGVQHENVVATELRETTLPTLVRQVTLPKETVYCADDGTRFHISGICDGLTADGVLVEIKSRQSRLFNHLRTYELIQLQMYLHLAKREQGLLVETFGSDSRSYPVTYNPSLCEKILDRLAATLGFLCDVLFREDAHILEQIYNEEFTMQTIHPEPLLP